MKSQQLCLLVPGQGSSSRLGLILAALSLFTLLSECVLMVIQAPPAEAAFGARGVIAFPSPVTVGQTFPASVTLSNESTPPEAEEFPVLALSNIRLRPSCYDCYSSVSNVFRLSATGVGVSPSPSCQGTWIILRENANTRVRFIPPGGEGSLQLAAGQSCSVSFTATVLRVPIHEDVSFEPGIQTYQRFNFTASVPGLGSVAGGDAELFTTVQPGANPIAVFRPTNGVWLFQSGRAAVAWGTAGDIPVPADYDGDGIDDVAVYRPSNGVWYILGGPVLAWGTAGDVPVPADYDGNGTDDIAVYRPSNGVWFVHGRPAMAWGTAGDLPVPADYDGDGTDDIAVYRPSDGFWFVPGRPAVAWGIAGDIPVPADYVGGGTDTPAVYRPSNGVWYLHGKPWDPVAAWGTEGDVPVPADYDQLGGPMELAVYRPSNGLWLVHAGPTVAWGTSGDYPIPLPSSMRAALPP